MGLPDSYVLPKGYNDAYHVAGDGVAVPVVRHLAAFILEPILAENSTRPCDCRRMIQLLEEFVTKSKIKNKGAVINHARGHRSRSDHGLPLKAANLVVERGGQVLGAGAAKVQATSCPAWALTGVLAKEGGRTSRGSIDNMKAYVAFLNDAHELGPLDLDIIEGFWVQKVREFFAANRSRFG